MLRRGSSSRTSAVTSSSKMLDNTHYPFSSSLKASLTRINQYLWSKVSQAASESPSLKQQRKLFLRMSRFTVKSDFPFLDALMVKIFAEKPCFETCFFLWSEMIISAGQSSTLVSSAVSRRTRSFVKLPCKPRDLKRTLLLSAQ